MQARKLTLLLMVAGLCCGFHVASSLADQSPDSLLQALHDGNGQDKQKAAAEIMARTRQQDADFTPALVCQKWIPALRGAKMSATGAKLAELALTQIADSQSSDDVNTITALWGLRIMTLAESGQGKEAVAVLNSLSGKMIGDTPLASNKGLFMETPESLAKLGLYKDAADVALTGILTFPGDNEIVTTRQQLRVEMLQKEKKFDAALEAAKAYYNVAPLQDTSHAIEMLSVCLINARPSDRGIARRFKLQQLRGSKAPSATQPADVPDNVLKTIPVDAKIYDDAIKSLQVTSYGNMIGRGNLQLLADRGKEARKCFESALDLANSDDEVTAATEGIVKAIRAEDGSVGRANAYLQEQQKGK